MKEANIVTNYIERNKVLRDLGFRTYQDYLHSKLWKIIRKYTLIRDRSKCRIVGCCNEATQVHHLAYSRRCLMGVTIYLVVSICKECHKKLEYSDTGEKRTLEEVMKATLIACSSKLVLAQNGSNPKLGTFLKRQAKISKGLRMAIVYQIRKYIPEWFELYSDIYTPLLTHKKNKKKKIPSKPTREDLGWLKSNKGNLWRTFEGKTITLFHQKTGRYNWCIAENKKLHYSKCGFATEEEAMVNVLGYLNIPF